LVINVSDDEAARWRAGYDLDPKCKGLLEKASTEPGMETPNGFSTDDKGLLFYHDLLDRTRLYVPVSLRPSIMDEVHNSRTESAHAG
ncbi:hypothetical protein SISNIDRAFT_398935, partial [Sistotremastrum niveocremeum HHB9708]